MSQLTIRDVDQRLGDALRHEAARRGLSVNRLVLQLLRESMGQAAETGEMTFSDLDAHFGTWSDTEAIEFEQQIAAQRTVDEALWP